MGVRLSSWAMAGLLVAGVACAQVDKHPITTAPEGQAPPGCSYSMTDANGKVTGTNTCAPNALPPVTPVQESNEEICKRESKQDRELDLRCPSGDASTKPPAASAKEKFPFPGEAPAAQTPQQSAPTAQKFPFPGEDSLPAQPKAQSPLQDAGSSGSSSSDMPESSSSNDNRPPSADDVDSDTPVAPVRNMRKKPSAVKEQTKEQRVAEDLNVAEFYTNDKNFSGAYLRAKDAVSLADDDPEAHMALANAARKLGKLDEARKNFERTLALDPVPKTKKEAQQALREMTGG